MVADLNAFDLIQGNVFIAAERKIVATKNNLLLGNLDEMILVQSAHKANSICARMFIGCEVYLLRPRNIFCGARDKKRWAQVESFLRISVVRKLRSC